MIAVLSHKQLDVPETALFLAMLNWAHIDGVATDRQKSLITPLLPHIDFAKMHGQDLAQHVEPTKILSGTTMAGLFRDIALKAPAQDKTRLKQVRVCAGIREHRKRLGPPPP